MVSSGNYDGAILDFIEVGKLWSYIIWPTTQYKTSLHLHGAVIDKQNKNTNIRNKGPGTISKSVLKK